MILLQKKQQKTFSQDCAKYLGGIRQRTGETSTRLFAFVLADFESCANVYIFGVVLQICIIVIEIISKGNVTFSSFSINWFRIVTVSSSDRWLDYTKPSFNSEGSETKRLRLFRPLFYKLRMKSRARSLLAPLNRCMHKIMLDCTLIFRIKTSKTAFSWLKTLNTFGCNRQGTEKMLKERTLSISRI